ncbi:hypothetical protein [Aquimarina addita]|uniref:hypothetical protein n=1 Tax=Aquimarina addita TaxID=870485 RepID=UPI0031E8B540
MNKTSVFKPYSGAITTNKVKKRLKTGLLLHPTGNDMDDVLYKTNVFYLNLMIFIKRYWDIISYLLVLMFTLFLIIWLFGNL